METDIERHGAPVKSMPRKSISSSSSSALSLSSCSQSLLFSLGLPSSRTLSNIRPNLLLITLVLCILAVSPASAGLSTTFSASLLSPVPSIGSIPTFWSAKSCVGYVWPTGSALNITLVRSSQRFVVPALSSLNFT